MTLVKWDPFKELLTAHNELGRLFNWTFGLAEDTKANWAPAIDVYEENDKLVVKADLPGVKPEDVEVKVTPTHLVIKGQREDKSEVKKEQFYRFERSYGAFERVIPLPDDIKQEEVAAAYKNGVLEVTLPRTQTAKPKEIKVEVKSE